MPVSETANATTWAARFSSSWSELQPVTTSSMVSVTLPWWVNLKALDSRFFRICCRRLMSVTIAVGSCTPVWIRKSTFLASATWRKVRSTYSCRSDRRSSLTSTATVPDSILDRSRMSLISISRSLPDEWIVLANSTCLVVRLPSGFLDSWSDRISSEFSGVRSSCDMLARNSDLYLDVRASCLAFSSSAWRACSTSWFLRSTSWFWCTSRRAFSCSSSLVCCSSCWRLWSSCASDCDCVSRSSVRMLASIVLITMPMDSASWSRNCWWVGLKRSSDASSTTPRTCPSKMMGSTSTFIGDRSVRPDEMRSESGMLEVSRIFFLSNAHWPTRPSPRSTSLP
jgi:hypothetical protein